MGRIQTLPDVLASQVAAGEVVERPASVVKELVENAVDAGAVQVVVEVQRGGVALIRVVDDGCGMSPEDAEACLGRHATSKLRTSDDLGKIMTLGFRGEAMPSIASVSRLTLRTREAEAVAGTEVVVEGGRVTAVHEAGGAPGTSVEVRELFFNVPARRKFLRTETTEFAHVEQVLRVQALAHPDTGFTLLRDGRTVFQLPPKSGLRHRIEGLAGSDVASGLIEVRRVTRRGLTAWGFIGAPGRTRADRSWQLSFVNGRPVESPVIWHALRAALGAQGDLPRGQHAVCFLFLQLDPGAVDVNVHPAKKEVRFHDGHGVQAALVEILQEALRGGGGEPENEEAEDQDEPAEVNEPPRTPVAEKRPDFALDPPRPTLAASARGSQQRLDLRMHPPASAARSSEIKYQSSEPKPQTPPSGGQAPAPTSPTAPLTPTSAPAPAPEKFKLIGLMDPLYVLWESLEGLVLMELRAAHERVLYEDLRRQMQAGAVASQRLLVPVPVRLAPSDFALAMDQSEALARLGFGVEDFGENTVKIDALPAWPGLEDPAALLEAVLDDLHTLGESGARARLDVDALASAVCARAVPRAGRISPAEAESLLARLLACDMPYCDPAGRPTLVQLSFSELARKFGRR